MVLMLCTALHSPARTQGLGRPLGPHSKDATGRLCHPPLSKISPIYQLYRCIPLTRSLVGLWVLTVGCTWPSISLWFSAFIVKTTFPSLPDSISALPQPPALPVHPEHSLACHSLSQSSHIPIPSSDALCCPHFPPATPASDPEYTTGPLPCCSLAWAVFPIYVAHPPS